MGGNRRWRGGAPQETGKHSHDGIAGRGGHDEEADPSAPFDQIISPRPQSLRARQRSKRDRLHGEEAADGGRYRGMFGVQE
jgi:hypothetical protein